MVLGRLCERRRHVLWGALLRVTLGLHATWLVNSATHMWGKRRFETHDDSRNSWWVALLTGGEGWHTTTRPPRLRAPRPRLVRIDPNFWGIWILSKLGLARKVQVAKFDRKNPSPPGSSCKASPRDLPPRGFEWARLLGRGIIPGIRTARNDCGLY